MVLLLYVFNLVFLLLAPDSSFLSIYGTEFYIDEMVKYQYYCLCLLYRIFLHYFGNYYFFNSAIMPGIFALELMKVIFIVSICPSS